jgi:hypothetical protein
MSRIANGWPACAAGILPDHPRKSAGSLLESGAAMTKTFAILTLLLTAGGLAACSSSGENGAGAGSYSCGLSCGYVGRFDNDENRLPMLVDNIGRNPPPQILIYGDGEH